MATVCNRLEKRGMPRRPSGARRPDIDTRVVARRYRAGETLKDIASSLGCCARTVVNRLEERGIPRRPKGTRHLGPIAAGRVP